MKFYVGGLTSALAGLSQSQLGALEMFWEIDPDAISSAGSARTLRNSERLASAMGSTWAAMAVVEKLTPPQRSVLKTIIEKGNIHHTAIPELEAESQDALFKVLLENLVVLIVHSWAYGGRGSRWSGKLPLPKDAYLGVPGETIASLSRALLLFETTPEERVSESLAALMREVDSAELGMLMGLAPRLIARYASSLFGLLASSIRYPEQVQKLLQRVSPRARRMFAELTRAGAPVRLPDLLSGPGVGAQEVLPLLNDLYTCGLVFPLFLESKRACFVPPEVLASARGEGPQRPVPDDTLKEAAPESLVAAGQGFWWNLMVAGLYLETGRGELTASTRQLPRKIINQLVKSSAPALDSTDEKGFRIDQAIYWLGASGLLVVTGSRISVDEDWQKWRSSSLMEQVAWLLDGWANGESDECMLGIPGIEDSEAALRLIRCKLLQALQETPSGQWFSLASWSRRILSRDPFFLRSRKALLEMAGEAGVDDLYQSWRRHEGRYLLRELVPFPLQCGLVDLGWEEGSDHTIEPTCLRIPEFGKQVLDAITVQPAVGKTIKVELKNKPDAPERVLVTQPNLEVVLLRFEPRAAYALGRFAQPVSFDRVGSFRITAESVRGAASRGITFAEMKETLDRFSTNPVPQNVEYQLKDWVGTVRNVRFERGTVVEVDSPEDLEALLSSKAIRSRVIRRLSPTAALLAVGEDVKALGKNLEPQGFSWNPPPDWEQQEAAAYTGITKTLKRFEPSRSGWERY